MREAYPKLCSLTTTNEVCRSYIWRRLRPTARRSGQAMRETFHAELDKLIGGLARMARLAGQVTTNASTVLHHADWCSLSW